jgi:hypothetical protein
MRMALCIWLVYIGGQLSWRGISGPQDAQPAPSVVVRTR